MIGSMNKGHAWLLRGPISRASTNYYLSIAQQTWWLQQILHIVFLGSLYFLQKSSSIRNYQSIMEGVLFYIRKDGVWFETFWFSKKTMFTSRYISSNVLVVWWVLSKVCGDGKRRCMNKLSRKSGSIVRIHEKTTLALNDPFNEQRRCLTSPGDVPLMLINDATSRVSKVFGLSWKSGSIVHIHKKTTLALNDLFNEQRPCLTSPVDVPLMLINDPTVPVS
jgi:hypothetical protein